MEGSQRRHGNKEAVLSGEEQKLRQQLEEETNVNQRITEHLKKHYEVRVGVRGEGGGGYV